MTLVAGIALIDLFDATDQVTSVLPQDISDFLRRFSIRNYRSTQSPGAIIHHGVLQSNSDAVTGDSEAFDIGIGTLTLPLVNGGLPFQLSMTRAAVGGAGGALEAGAANWQLTINLSEFILTLNGLETAQFVKESGTVPRHLVRDPAAPPVRIIGSAAIRFSRSPTNGVTVDFADHADPLDPGLATGGVASLTFSPPHFFFGSSQVGMTAGQLLFDSADNYSPQQIIDAGQGPEWVGMLIREATVYAPRNLPVVGDLSGGVRDVLIGNPLGIQGQLELQFGRSPLNPDTFLFKQELDGPNLAVAPGGTSRLVTLQGGQDEDFTVHAGMNAPPPSGSTPSWSANWSFDGGTSTEGVSATGQVRHGSVLRVIPLETIDGVTHKHPDVTFRFVAAGEGAEIQASVGGNNLDNAIHIGGPVADLNTISLTASSSAPNPGGSTFTWTLEAAGISETGAMLALALPEDLTGEHNLTLREEADDDTVRVTRLRLSIKENGATLVGTETGVFDMTAPGLAKALSAVEATYDLSDFHSTGEIRTQPESATLNAGSPAGVDVPADAIARVTVTDPAIIGSPVHDRHVQVLMEFEKDRVLGWGEHRPAQAQSASGEADLQTMLLSWAANYPGADFLIIGRCDDIGQVQATEATVDSFNLALALQRAAKGKSLLTTLRTGASGTVLDAARIYTRGETGAWDRAQGDTLEENADIQPTNMPAGRENAWKFEAVGQTSMYNGWLIKTLHEGRYEGWQNKENTDEEALRAGFRRVDIYAVGGTPTDAAISRPGVQLVAEQHRRSWVPANGRLPTEIATSSPELDYRVKLLVGWDSPKITSWKDAVPALVEAEFAWTPTETPLPNFDGNSVPVSPASEVLTVYAKWVHDSRTEFTRLTLGIRSDGDPDGLASTDQKQLTAALALGPMLLSGVDFDDDMIGSAARIAALGAGIGFAGTVLKDDSKTTLISVEAEAQTRALSDPGVDYQIKLTAEYTTTLHVDADLGVIQLETTPDAPLKIRYKDVGIEFDNSQSGWDKIGFAYETNSMQIENGGRWRVGGILGELLRISEVAMGVGSLWIELRIAVGLEIGVVEISEAIIRMVFEDGDPIPKFELRGFVLSASIPAVLEGEGRLRIEDGGVIRAGVSCDVIPLGAKAEAALALGKPAEIDPSIFMSLYLGVQFSTPIPLGQSGAALYGFKGMFGMNAGRDEPTITDPVQRELAWWNLPPEQKYEPEKDQYAIGLGIVAGTMPDASFSFSASGMVVVSFPDPEVILGVDVNIISVPDTTASDERGAESNITGLIVIDDEAVIVAVSATYDIPTVLSIKLPFGAYFPYSGNGAYVRIGSDGAAGRPDDPVTITFLPGTLDVKAWAYLMIEEGGLPSLGGDARFTFDGFSVGFGAGWGIEWSAGPISLSASAKVLVGFGTNPLMIKGGVFFAGELDLVILSISANGELILTYLDGDVFVEGEVCGEVDLFFFSISGCVGVSFGTQRDADEVPPPPESPVGAIILTDRKDRIMGQTVPQGTAIQGNPLVAVSDNPGPGQPHQNTGAAPKDNQVVWPDTAPVIQFKHYVESVVPTGQFDISDTPSQPIWFGGNQLKYTYRVRDIRLVRVQGNEPVAAVSEDHLQSVWTTTPYKQEGSDGEDGNPIPSEHEGPNLKLLDWDPWTWVVNTTNGGEDTGGDPADDIDDICDPKPQPRLACVYGRAAVPCPWYKAQFRQETLAEPPYPSRFYATGEPAIRFGNMRLHGQSLYSFLASSGASIRPGHVSDLPFATSVNGVGLTRGYRMPWAERAHATGFETFPLPYEAKFDRDVTRPSLRLMVCEDLDDDEGKNCVELTGKDPGTTTMVLEHDKYVFRALLNDHPLRLVDEIDTSGSTPVQGSDGTPEIAVPARGMFIALRTPCPQLELWFMRFGDTQMIVSGVSADGSEIAPVTVDQDFGVAVSARLAHPSGVSLVRIQGASGKDLLYRLCCIGGGTGTGPEDCETFRKLKPRGSLGNAHKVNGIELTSVDPAQEMILFDEVDQNVEPPVMGSDGSGEIRIPGDGLKITLPDPCPSMRLGIVSHHGEPVKITGFDASGSVVAQATAPTTQGVPHIVALNSNSGDTGTVILEGGGHEALLFRICCLQKPVPGSGEECETFRGFATQGSLGSQFDHNGLRFETLVDTREAALRDLVDQSVEPPRRGSDGSGEIGFPSDGIAITLPEPCLSVTLGIMVFNPQPVTAVGLDANGNQVAEVTFPTSQSIAHLRSLTPSAGEIAQVILKGGANEAVLFRVCCKTGEDTGTKEVCRIVDARFRGKPKSAEVMPGITAVSLAPRAGIASADFVNVAGGTAKPGKDRKRELIFPDDGVRLVLDDPCDQVSVKLMLFAGPVKAEAIGADGKVIARASSHNATKTPQTLSFTGKGIQVIEIRRGKGEAAIYEICCVPSKQVRTGITIPDRVIDTSARISSVARSAALADLPQVKGMQNGDPEDDWDPRIIESRRADGRRCQVIEYRPRAGQTGPWDGVQIAATRNRQVWLLSLCGVDQVMQDARDLDEDRRQHRIADLTAVLTLPVNQRREVLLEPGEDYRLEIDWDWNYWRSNEDGTNTPPTTPDAGTWQPLQTETHLFRIADIAADTDATQDGLNEYVFDPSDVARYLTNVEPVDGRSTHFTDDPVWVHFDNGQVEHVLDQYDRSLDIIVRRTDPPPQSTQAQLADLIAPLVATNIFWTNAPVDYEPLGNQRIAGALSNAPCLPDGNPGGGSIGAEFDLEPRAMYDFELHATPNGGGDPAMVSATRFVTSRYANPTEMLTHMGYGTSTRAAYGPDDLILPAGSVLPSGPVETSDALIDAFLEEIDASTLPLPKLRPETYALWRLNGTSWQIEGLLVDALESLNRTITQREADKAVIAPRCVLSSGRIGAHNLTPVRASANWTRVLLVPNAPITLPADKHDLALTFTTNGPDLTGTRVIGHQPSLIQREGF